MITHRAPSKPWRAPGTADEVYSVTCNGSYSGNPATPILVTAMPGGAAPLGRTRLTKAQKAARAYMLDPSRRLMREGRAQSPVGPEPAP